MSISSRGSPEAQGDKAGDGEEAHGAQGNAQEGSDEGSARGGKKPTESRTLAEGPTEPGPATDAAPTGPGTGARSEDEPARTEGRRRGGGAPARIAPIVAAFMYAAHT